MPDHDDDLDRELRRLGEHLDAASRPTTAHAAMERVAPASPSARRRLLPVLGVAAAVAIGLLVVRATGEDEAPVDAVDQPTTTAPPDSTTVPVDPSGDAARYDLPPEDWPAAGVAVVEDGDVVFLDETGRQLGRVEGAIVTKLESARSSTVITVTDVGIFDVEAPTLTAPADCDTAAEAGGLRVALCGGEPQIRSEIVRVGADGETTPLIGVAPGSNGTGLWRWALPSPDGQWVLAFWSGECESPTGFLISADGREVHTVDGEAGLSQDSLESFAIGWTTGGRAIVRFTSGICGTGIDQPGTYLVDAATSEAELLWADPQDRGRTFRWQRTGSNDTLTEIEVPGDWPTAPVFAATLLDDSVVLADPMTGEPVLQLLPASAGRWSDIALAPDGQAVYLTSLVDYGGGDLVRLRPGAAPEVIGAGASVAVSPDGSRLAVTGATESPQAITVLEAATGAELGRVDLGATAPQRGDLYPRDVQWHPDGTRLLVEAGNPEEPSSLYLIDVTTGSADRLGPPDGVPRGTGWALAGSVGTDQVLVIEACCALDANSYDGGSTFLWVDATSGTERERASLGGPYARAFVDASGSALVIDQCCGSPEADLFRRGPSGDLTPLGGPSYATVDW